ncbi:MAG: family 43 glycosylhydrolase [Opitutaceae bacterium]|nr:family 43 glycosylhydrolase [Opitutaceae bacterium]
MPSLSAIQLRDPFILPDPAAGLYRLYGTTALGGPMEAPDGFVVRTSPDLRQWSAPRPVLGRSAGPAGADFFWAPEVHAYRGRWYLFASYGAGMNVVKPRAHYTAIHVASTPDGPFAPHSDGPVTPLGWFCIDGTLHVDGTGQPWVVFVREWTQVVNGEIHALPLRPDLRRPAGEPRLLFRASSAPWSLVQKSDFGEGYRVTDGPWLHRTAAGTLLLLWSTFGRGGYITGIARSLSGDILGPWEQEPTPLYADDGGHPMLFRDFKDRLTLALHAPNIPLRERVRLLPMEETAEGLKLLQRAS